LGTPHDDVEAGGIRNQLLKVNGLVRSCHIPRQYKCIDLNVIRLYFLLEFALVVHSELLQKLKSFVN
jgi:hypothetical protein